MLSQAKVHKLEEGWLEQKPRLHQLRDIGPLALERKEPKSLV